MYELYLGELKLPLLPESLKESGSKDNKKYNILAIGEVVRPGRAKLRSWTINTTLEHTEIDVTGARDYIMRYVSSDTEGTKPFRFILNRRNDDGTLTFDTNTLVIIDSYDFTDVAGQVGDLDISLKLIEYKEFGGKILA